MFSFLKKEILVSGGGFQDGQGLTEKRCFKKPPPTTNQTNKHKETNGEILM